MFLISFYTIDKKVDKIEIPNEATVKDVKQIYANKVGKCESNCIKIIHDKKVLQDHIIISSLGLKENDFLLIITNQKKMINPYLQTKDKPPMAKPLPTTTDSKPQANKLSTSRIKMINPLNIYQSAKKKTFISNKRPNNIILLPKSPMIRKRIHNPKTRRIVRFIIIINPRRSNIRNLLQLANIHNSKCSHLCFPAQNYMIRMNNINFNNNIRTHYHESLFHQHNIKDKIKISRIYQQLQFHFFIILLFSLIICSSTKNCI
ncbi:hypothetical protein M9Y10_025208 [Tritrichomonas musculus]|uniref:Ubiquitin-like domain-containing protein n=1 Tax=Tritrichomonas musculus TaxID=1915356 RepID=A0ABR2H9W0_9EUKA